MNPLLDTIIRQEASRLGIGKYSLSSQSYVLVNNGAITPALKGTDESVSHNLYTGEGLPLKPLQFRLEQNVLFIHRLEAYFADYESFAEIRSAGRIVRYDYLSNCVQFPSAFPDEYRLSSEMISVHQKDVQISAQFLQSSMCRVVLEAILLRRE